MDARGRMPLVDEVIMTEDYQTGTAILDSISNQAICKDLDVRWGDGSMDLSARSICLDGDILLLLLAHQDVVFESSFVNWRCDCWDWGMFILWDMKSCSQEGEVLGKICGLRPI